MKKHEMKTSNTPFDKRALIYLRTSTAVKREISRQEQEDACLKHLAQHGYTNIVVFNEDDSSGSISSENRN